MRRYLWIVPVLLLFAVIVAPAAQADEITYTITGTGTTGAFTLAFTGDTANAQTIFGVEVVPVTGTFNFSGGAVVGTFNSTDTAGSPLVVDWNPSSGVVSFNYLSFLSGGDPAVVTCAVPDPSFSGLNSTPGALPCVPGGAGGNFATNLGLLNIPTPNLATGVTFSAVVATPEPSSLVLLATGLFGVMGMTLCRKRLA